jgi:hypothetical protein
MTLGLEVSLQKYQRQIDSSVLINILSLFMPYEISTCGIKHSIPNLSAVVKKTGQIALILRCFKDIYPFSHYWLTLS